MAIEEDKKKLFEDNNYKYYSSRAIYHNKSQGKVFSEEFIEDNEAGKLNDLIEASNDDWVFNFSYPIDDLGKKNNKRYPWRID